MNNLQDFLKAFPFDFQRPYKFVCQIYPTQVLAQNISLEDGSNNTGGIFNTGSILNLLGQGLLIDSAMLPSRSFGVIDLSMYGLTEHFPYHPEYSSLKCNFLLPITESSTGATGGLSDNPVLRFFNYWHDQIQDNAGGASAGFDWGFPADYYAVIDLTMFDSQNRGTITYEFTNAYPKVVSEVQVSWAETSRFATLPVEFVFSYWTILNSQATSLLTLT